MGQGQPERETGGPQLRPSVQPSLEDLLQIVGPDAGTSALALTGRVTLRTLCCFGPQFTHL